MAATIPLVGLDVKAPDVYGSFAQGQKDASQLQYQSAATQSIQTDDTLKHLGVISNAATAINNLTDPNAKAVAFDRLKGWVNSVDPHAGSMLANATLNDLPTIANITSSAAQQLQMQATKQGMSQSAAMFPLQMQGAQQDLSLKGQMAPYQLDAARNNAALGGINVSNAQMQQSYWQNQMNPGAGGAVPVAKYVADVTGTESGGNPYAKNPDSSALGLGQFIDSTWNGGNGAPGLVNTPEGRAAGLTPNGRTDPNQARAAVGVYAQQSARVLAAAGIPVTEQTLYLAHFLGPDGAVKALKADPNTPGAALFPDAAASNPRLFGNNRTIGQIIAYQTRSLSPQPVDFGGGQPQPAAVASQPPGGPQPPPTQPAAYPTFQPGAPGGVPSASAPAAASPAASAPAPGLDPIDPTSDPLVQRITQALQVASRFGDTGRAAALKDLLASRLKQIQPAAETNKAPPGYRYATDGQSLEPIPGGPAASLLTNDPDAVKLLAQNYVNGKALPSRFNPQDRKLVIDQAKAMNGGVDPAVSQADAQTTNYMIRDLGKLSPKSAGGTINTVNTAISHLDLLSQAFHALQNGGVQALNSMNNAFQQEFGAPAPASYQAIQQMAAGEISNMVIGGVGGEGERGKFTDSFSRASSPEQFDSVVGDVKNLAAGRIQSARQQYRTHGLQARFDAQLEPGTLQALGVDTSGDAGGSPSAPSAGTVIKYDAQGNRVQ